jgi:hypothetical protein
MEDGVHHTLTNASLVAEVLSNSTEKYDRGLKFSHYRRLDTLQEYLLIAQDRFSVEVFQRHDAGSSSAGSTSSCTSCRAQESNRCRRGKCGEDVLQEPSLCKSGMRVDGQRAAVSERNSLKTSHFAGGHVNKHFVFATTEGGKSGSSSFHR